MFSGEGVAVGCECWCVPRGGEEGIESVEGVGELLLLSVLFVCCLVGSERWNRGEWEANESGLDGRYE